MILKKRNIVLISAISAALIIGIVFLSLGLTIWRPKTTEEWLNDFGAALVLKHDLGDRKTEKTIVVTEGGTENARYYQLVEVHTEGDRTVAHLKAEQKFPSLGTAEFDTHDEYYFYDDTMYMRRDNGGEITRTSFSSTWEVFWEVVNENMEQEAYKLEKSVFNELKIAHDGGVHSMNACVAEDKKAAFFGMTEEAGAMSEVRLSIQMDDNLNLTMFKMSYKFEQKQDVTIEINSGASNKFEIRDITEEE